MGSKRLEACMLAAFALLATAGCGGEEPATSAHSVEQEAIRKYSEATPAVSKHLDSFVEVWNEAFVSGEVTPVVTAVNEKTVAALDALIDALKQMPTESADLEQIHNSLVTEYEKTRTALEVFAKTLSDSNRKEPVDALTRQLHALAQTESSYHEELKGYYASHNVQLAPPISAMEQVAPSAPSPQPGAKPSTP